MEIVQIPVLADNYNYLLHDEDSGETAVIDPSLHTPILEALAERGWTLDKVFNTHHHWDHTDGNEALKAATGCTVYGYGADADRIPGLDVALNTSDHVSLGKTGAELLFLPGHTKGHIAYYFADEKALFSGDVLFGAGCGRLFEGTPEQMYSSLQSLMTLPDDTRIFCGHEYTERNVNFALELEPGNEDLQTRKREVEKLRRGHKPTIPTSVALEKATNPFLRCGSDEIRANLRVKGEGHMAVFTAMRARRDHF